MREMNKPNYDCQSYWRRTGAKFMGTDEELRSLLSDCGKQFEMTDEEGYFNSFYCTVDWKKCDKCCSKHNSKLDDWIKPFVQSINERFKQ